MRSQLVVTILIVIFSINTDASSLPERLLRSTAELRNHTKISEFRLVNRMQLAKCFHPNPYLKISVTSNPTLSDEEYVTVNITGVWPPSITDWVAMISPSHTDVKTCFRIAALMYQQTGDLTSLPLLCHYPVKAQYVSNDPEYLKCSKSDCEVSIDGKCTVKTCGATLSFHVINIRTDIEFVMFTGGFKTPCMLSRSDQIKFANPNQPLYAHVASVDSTATSMRLTWVSGDRSPQQVQYGDAQTAHSSVSTFSQDDMCTSWLESPAVDFGWHDPGFIHSAIMTGLRPSTNYSYKYGSDSVGWSDEMKLRTPPASGSDELKFLAYGDMGKAPLDSSVEHYTQPGSVSVIKAMEEEVSSGGRVDSIFHIGDISYATGFMAEWDFFLHLISPLASQLPYMTAIGNHERDYIDSGSVYVTPDSGGECGVAYETYFPMPTAGKDKPWYSIEQGPVHFTVISTEHNWTQNSEQYEWMNKDMGAVNRTTTPWLIFTGHRPMYSSSPRIPILPSVDNQFVEAVEPLLLANKVDLVLFGHIHNYERTCAVYNKECRGMPTKDSNGVDTYQNSNYTAPVHAVIGIAGFELDSFTQNDNSWSLVRISKYGYLRVHATKSELHAEIDVPNDVAAALRRGLLRPRSLDESGALLDETLEVALALR
ncbi:probable inactive purple acid phosphatase 27 isoform X1 [Salvia splendens]|uniref:probable inactive purple acid phosphatase 27 isoform X1 n=1 Tax=Salvia splendens TaxID=180675 RepID=UPI001C270FFA|nr:probable inactive purple acid phosphatase 27 isoform X1 [Salvia splendens]